MEVPRFKPVTSCFLVGLHALDWMNAFLILIIINSFITSNIAFSVLICHRSARWSGLLMYFDTNK